ncbi:MAG: CvpA family protein [Pontiellaceae bacterium]|nr:CvpA family protein [Pontiellaceae bacterium]MBN2785419.1 CvpA family protein [Pontiellaceae bacterium]
MHFIIDFIVGILLLHTAWRGWRKGVVLSSLGVLQIVLSSIAAYFAGRHLGPWLAEAMYRPRIVMMPVTAGLTFVSISFGIQILMWKISEGYRVKIEKEAFHLPWIHRLGGSLVSFASGVFTTIVFFWLLDLALTGVSGHGIPGADRSTFGRFAQRAAYEGVYMATAKEGRESQAAATARVISNPAKGIRHLRNVLSADSIKDLLVDPDIGQDLLSGDPERVELNLSIQALLADRNTLNELKELGIISGKETRSGLCDKLSSLGKNETIRYSIENLKMRDLLRTDKITLLIRDPYFDVIVQELLK